MAKKKGGSMPISCRVCRYAHLVQWGNDPVITICKAKGNERFVTNAVRFCELYQASDFEIKVEQRIKDF